MAQRDDRTPDNSGTEAGPTPHGWNNGPAADGGALPERGDPSAHESANGPEGAPGDCEIIERPNLLKKRTQTKNAKPVGEMVEAGDTVVAQSAEAYEAEMRDLLARIERELDELQAGATDPRATTRALDAVLHELKGSAGTFNWQLMSAVATSACDFLYELEQAETHLMAKSGRYLQVMELHRQALRAVQARQLSGPIQGEGRELLENLHRLIAQEAADVAGSHRESAAGRAQTDSQNS